MSQYTYSTYVQGTCTRTVNVKKQCLSELFARAFVLDEDQHVAARVGVERSLREAAERAALLLPQIGALLVDLVERVAQRDPFERHLHRLRFERLGCTFNGKHIAL